MSNDPATRRKMFRELRNLGFVEVYRSRGGGAEVYEFRAEREKRFLRLQLWSNGKHTVSNGSIGKYGDWESLAAHGLPTEFTDLCSMYRAIAFNWQRPLSPIPCNKCQAYHVVGCACAACGHKDIHV